MKDAIYLSPNTAEMGRAAIGKLILAARKPWEFLKGLGIFYRAMFDEADFGVVPCNQGRLRP
jgi:hypothetical protein